MVLLLRSRFIEFVEVLFELEFQSIFFCESSSAVVLSIHLCTVDKLFRYLPLERGEMNKILWTVDCICQMKPVLASKSSEASLSAILGILHIFKLDTIYMVTNLMFASR